MAPINPPQYLQAGVYSARSDRLVTAAHMTPDHGTDALAMRSGVRPTPGNAGLAVTQRTTPSMFVTVAAGTAWIQSTAATGGGYLVVNDAPYDVPITTAHATLGRRDLIVARIYDAELSGSVNQWTLEVVTGAPAGSPTPPALPPGSMALATVLVNPAATTIVNGNITDTRVYTTSLGGTTPALATALPTNPYKGQAAYDLTNSRPTWHNGTAWQSWMEDPALRSQLIIKCTSTTRPSSPTEGWHIYETDTKRHLIYQSGAWKPVNVRHTTRWEGDPVISGPGSQNAIANTGDFQKRVAYNIPADNPVLNLDTPPAGLWHLSLQVDFMALTTKRTSGEAMIRHLSWPPSGDLTFITIASNKVTIDQDSLGSGEHYFGVTASGFYYMPTPAFTGGSHGFVFNVENTSVQNSTSATWKIKCNSLTATYFGEIY